MQSLYEVKNPMSFDSEALAHMYNTAKDLLRETTPQQYTQTIVLLTASNKEYGAVIHNAISQIKSDEKALLHKLRAASDTEIRYVLCMWANGGVDIPSYHFRKMLFELNHKNEDAGILIRAKDGYSAMKLGITLKH